MSATTILNMLNAQLGFSPKTLSTDVLNERNSILIKLTKVLEGHDASELLILRDESRTQSGKAAALKTPGTDETSPALKFMKNIIDGLETKDANYRKRFFSVDSGIVNITERMAVFGYLWNKFDTLDQSARVTQFAQAAEQDQVRVLASMLEHPLVDTMVSDDVRQRTLTARARRLYPQPYDNFEQNQVVLELLVMIRDWLGRWLGIELRVEISILRTNLGDAVGDFLDAQTRTGLPQPNTAPELAGALQ